MLQPTKYLDLDSCTVRIASIIVTELLKYHAIRLNELDSLIQNTIGEKGKVNFYPALNFLFLTGTIEYDEKADSFYIPSKILKLVHHEII